MSRLIALILALLLVPAWAEDANLSTPASGSPGAVSRLVLAQSLYLEALASGDTITLLAAIRLARSVKLRQPVAWSRTTEGEVPADQPLGREAPPDPGGFQAIYIAQDLAQDVPDLQDLVYALDAQLPQGRLETATTALAALGGGQADTWRISLFGEVQAELGLIGDGDSPLGLTLTDEAGEVICTTPPSLKPALCRFTPARNGFFSVIITNPGAVQNSYLLVGN